MKFRRIRQTLWGVLALALTACQPATPPPLALTPTALPETAFVDSAILWRYAIPAEPPAVGWQSDWNFDDDDWLPGVAPIGNVRPARTFIGVDAAVQTLYLRATFNVDDDPVQWRGLTLTLDYLSGAAVYLNGNEIARANLDPQAGHSDLALLTHNTPAEVFEVGEAINALRPGPNLLAIEAHRRAEGGDVRVGAELTGVRAEAPPRFVFGPLLGRLGPDTITLQVEGDVPATALVEYALANALTNTVTVSPTLHHVIPLTNLQPGTTYHYRVGLQTEHGLTWSQTGQWTTDGGEAQSFQMAVWGSNAPRSGSSMHPVFTQLITALEARGPFAFGLTLGDSLELLPGTPDEATLRARYLNYLAAIAPLTRHMPLYPALGNHDNPECAACVQAFLNYYLLPEQNDQTYYSFDYGPAHLVVLNTQQRGGATINRLAEAQWVWLQADLKQTTQPVKLVFMHDDLFRNAEGNLPVFSENDRDLLHTLFRQTGVAAVFQADSHYYDYWEKDGVAYIITGGASDELYLQPFNPYWEQHQALIVRVSPTQVVIEAIMPDGLTLDQHILNVHP